MEIGSFYKNWNRSYKEDTENEIVLRPATYSFPAADRRGRAAIDLKPDKTFLQRGDIISEFGNFAADDRYNHLEGAWDVIDNDILSLTPSGSDPIKFKIVSLGNDKLVLEKIAVK